MTPQEIKMFDHPKIQNNWKPEVGDKYAFNKSIFIVRGNTVAVGRGSIFLPSIEQMAEMWCKRYVNAEAIVFSDHLYFWNCEHLINTVWPLNIIVLAFIMSDLHGLVWSEKGWVKP